MFFRRTLAAALFAGASFVNAARNITVYNNDTSIAYTGFSWRPYTNCGGTTYTYSKGQFFSFTFSGTAIYVIGTQSLEGGVINISLDGDQATFDRYAQPPYRCGVQYYGRSGLPNGSHTITVTLASNSPANATTDGFLEWQWLLYTQLDASDVTGGGGGGGIIGSTTGVASTSTRPTPGPTESPKSGGVSGAAIGGGVAGGLVALAALGVGIWFCMRRGKSGKSYGRADLGEGEAPYPAAPAQPYPTGSPAPMGQVGGYAGGAGAGAVPGSTPWTPDAYTQASLNPGQQPNAYPGFTPQPSYGSGPGSVASGPTQPLPGGASAYGGYAASSGYGGNPSNASYNLSNPDPASAQPLLAGAAGFAHGAYSSSGSQSGYAGGNTAYSVSNPDPSQNPYPAALQPGATGYVASTAGPGSSGSGGGGGMAKHGQSMHESDVDRIAARVASMMHQQQPAGYAGNAMPEYDAPPPMYNEKR